MAEAVITTKAKQKLLKARAGDQALSKIVGIAFGDGGVSSSGEVIIPEPSRNTLNNELMRKEVSEHTYIDDVTCRYSCTLEARDLVGKSISEMALYDAAGDLVAIKNFFPKVKDADVEMTFNIDDSF